MLDRHVLAYRHLRVILPALTGLGLLLLAGRLVGRGEMIGTAVLFLPAPAAAFLWLRALEYEGIDLFRPASPPWCFLASAGFATAAFLGGRFTLPGLLVGTVSALLVGVRPVGTMQALVTRPKLSGVFMTGACGGLVYLAAYKLLWKQMCHATALAAHFLFNHLLGMSVVVYDQTDEMATFLGGVAVHVHPAHSIVMRSQNFSVSLFAPCSGLEGIGLFFFLLSALILIDWRLFAKRHVLEIYLFAFSYTFVMNVLRIAAYFLLGHWAHAPSASAYLKSMQGLPLLLFHSWAGWCVYLVSFAIYIACVYKMMFGPATTSEKSRTPAERALRHPNELLSADDHLSASQVHDPGRTQEEEWH